VGWNIPIATDHFGSFNVENMIKFAQTVDKFNFAWLEDTVPWIYADDLVRIKNSCKTPITTGEDVYLATGFKELFEKKAISICHPDPAECGGIPRSQEDRRPGRSTQHRYLFPQPQQPHHAFRRGACRCGRGAVMALEFHNCDNMDEFLSVVTGVPKPIINDGFVTVPDRPGLGFDYDMQLSSSGSSSRASSIRPRSGTTNGLSTASLCSGYFNRRILRFRNHASVSWFWSEIWQIFRWCFTSSSYTGEPAPNAAPVPRATSGASSLASTTFTPLSQCSMCSPLATSREWFHSPTAPGRLPGRREHVIERARLVARTNTRIGVQGIVQQLVLEADHVFLAALRPPLGRSFRVRFTRSSNFIPGRASRNTRS